MKLSIEKIKNSKSIKELLEFSIINIDKPAGPTSFNVSDFVRKSLGLRKTSHFGTLDPKVTGVLPIALNRACKLTGYFLGEDKNYIGIARFHEEVSLKKIGSVIKEKFSGIIIQMPPVRSRVKRAEREREIHSFKLLESDGKDVLFSARVQGGTYIRKLIDDLGKELGIGAHMLELRRTEAGIFSEENKNYPSVNLYNFEKAVQEYQGGNETLLREILIPGEIIFELIEPVFIGESNLKRIYTGKPIHYEDLLKKQNFEKGKVISIFSKEEFIGIYKVVDDVEVFAKGEFVMQPLSEKEKS